MTRWRRGSDKYKVRIVYSAKRQAQITVPWPLIESFHRPDTVTFVFAERDIIVRFEKDDKSDKVSEKTATEVPSTPMPALAHNSNTQESEKPLWQRMNEEAEKRQREREQAANLND